MLSLGILAFVFAACGGDTEGTAERTPTPTPKASPSGPSANESASTSPSITLLSGEAPLPAYTIRDGPFAGEEGQTVLVTRCGGYGIVPGTEWVGVPPYGVAGCAKSHASAPGQGARLKLAVHTDYDVMFTMPPSFTSASISVLVLADNAAEIFVNGVSIGAQLTEGDHWKGGGNFVGLGPYGTGWPFTADGTSLLRPGANRLRFRVADGGGPTNLDYSVVITYSP